MPRNLISVDSIRQLASQNYTSRQIAEHLGLNQKSVCHLMRRHNMPRRPRGAQVGVPQKYKQADIDEPKMIRLYQSGMTCSGIAEVLGVGGYKPQETIRRRLDKLGVDRRIGGVSGEKSHTWRGGVCEENKDIRGKARYECYRTVLTFLGTPLPKGWVIHHIDDDPSNNNLSNLALFPSGSFHTRHHQWLLMNRTEAIEGDPIQLVLKNGGHPLQLSKDQTEAKPDKGLLSLLESEGKRIGFRTKWKHFANPGYRKRGPRQS